MVLTVMVCDLNIKRTNEEDRYVVPHNPYALEMWDAHMCVMKIKSNDLD